MMYVRYPLSLRNVEDLLAERGIDISHETVRFWWNRFGPMFAGQIRKTRMVRMRGYPQWPTAMVADAILDVTRRGDIVLDPFLGSGATLMACERTGRKCHGLELDPLYCDVIVRRWQTYTGAMARLAATGETFDAVAGWRGSTNGRDDEAAA
jgi:DNA methylase